MIECGLDWRTCGHCKASLECDGLSGVYPSCDKVGFLNLMFGDDMCPNAPYPAPEESLKRLKRSKERLEAQLMADGNDEMMKMLSKLFDIKAKYEKLKELLGKHVDNPEDLVEVEEVLGKAHADDLLDDLMTTAGYDHYDEFEEFVCEAARERKRHEGLAPLAWIEVEDHDGDGDIVTTPDFWDCECDDDYIHPHSEKRCPKCNARRDGQPDSRVNEVQAYFRNKLKLKDYDKEDDNAE